MRALGCLPLLTCLGLPAVSVSGQTPTPEDAAATVPSPAASRVYTNQDLERLAGRRGETGVESQPAVAPASGPRTGRSRTASDTGAQDLDADRRRLASAERYWRGQAEALRRRLLPQRQRLRELRASLERSRQRLDADRRRPSRRGSGSAEERVRSIEERVAALEQRLLSEQMLLEDRARRAGALPGWLR